MICTVDHYSSRQLRVELMELNCVGIIKLDYLEIRGND